jgi:dipeptidyl aminopeptidase/acylaminoacyl peptidase
VTVTEPAGAPSPVGRRAIVPDDLFRFRFLMGADLAPDGQTVVYALSRTDVDANADYTDLFLLDLESGTERQLTDGDAHYSSPAFSPSGDAIAFLSTQSGAPQIFVLPTAGGEAQQLTSLPTGVGGGPAWSPDAARIAFTAGPQEQRDPALPYRVSRRIWRADGIGVVDDAIQDVYVVDAAGGEPKRLTADAAMNFNPTWTADGQSIVYVSSHEPDSSILGMDLRRVDLDGTVTELVSDAGFVSSLTACPDGRIGYLLGWPADKLPGSKGDLFVVDPATREVESRASGLEVGLGALYQSDMLAMMLTMPSIAVSADGDHAYAPVQVGGDGNVFRFALGGPEAHESVVRGERVCAPVRLRGETLLFAGFDATDPGDLYLLNTGDGSERRLTNVNAELLDELALPGPQHLRFPSKDGVEVEAWFLPPAEGTPPHPTVLAIHGGPHASWGNVFNFDMLMFSGAGFGVLYVNYRGSSGYGDEFSTKIHLEPDEELDYADLMAAVDHAIELGLADPDRLGVFGISAGGALTGWIITHTDRFKAACPENPGFSLLSAYGTSDTGMFMERTIGGKPHERLDEYLRRSPLTYAHRCTTPTLFLQHEDDYRAPAEQTEQFYAVVKANDVPAEMLRFPGTGHLGSLLGPPSHRHAQNEALIEWMTRWVLAERG